MSAFRSNPTLTWTMLLSLTLPVACGGDDGSEDDIGDETSGTSETDGSDTTDGTETTDAGTDTTDTTGEEEAFSLTILHNNDGESQLVDAGSGLEDFGGVDRFVAKVDELRAGASSEGVVVLSSGDNFLAGPEFSLSLDKGVPFYDSLALAAVGYDAICLGNHDFDFGPATLADFIAGFDPQPAFLSANLDFAAEADLQALVDAGVIASSTVVDLGGQQVGVIGATTPMLPFISSPGGVVVDAALADVILAEVEALEAQGVEIIVLISHLQSIEEDLELATMLEGVDVMIAGGGDEVLANEGDVLVPGDEEEVYGSYPMMSDNGIPVVTTKGGYRYVGQLIASFEAGELVAIADESGVVRVAGGEQDDAIAGDAEVYAAVIEPVVAGLEALDMEIVGESEVELDGVKSNVRVMETNEGDLIADALLWQAAQLAADWGAATPDIGIQNGGGIRNDTMLPIGEISVLDTFDIAPFDNFVVVVEDVSPAQLEFVLENAYSQVENVDGRFAQISGFTVVYDPDAQGLEFDDEGNVVTEGERIIEVSLDDNTKIIEDGEPVDGAPSLNVATINFLAQGGDQYDFGGAEFVSLGVSYQQALANFIVEGLAGVISAADYPEGGEGRIATQ
ncbi:5'-nucleotidase C-terminal domain-containing protein [Pseudenhygromyxa sp. WMMC2535]|uniref:bifunctional metallophosphatase/5'-nucleotidase n=1 Tax=Pseudenhygromyxa sp. WMMC2535 TaxID=2712867 RepID=UPI0015570B5A|nr:5'-nucleotidase C-terminal domain-containing protein [Pseudenhygromyxa sp. WMMC2535]NVB36657.1 5'-nucleotidase C-terminal domain-containing protein [Pseudenhygromyxa sp. WMMC2535]